MELREREAGFHEVQRFRRWWLFLLLAVVAAVGWWAFIEQIVLGHPWGDKPAPDWVVWLVFVLFGVGMPLLLLGAKLVVEVTATELRVDFVPFRRRRFERRDLVGVEPVTFRPIRDWGGWGIRFSKGMGWAYTIKGTTGVRLDLADGKMVTVGTQRPEELTTAIRKLLS